MTARLMDAIPARFASCPFLGLERCCGRLPTLSDDICRTGSKLSPIENAGLTNKRCQNSLKLSD
jgi:hypothetical protein